MENKVAGISKHLCPTRSFFGGLYESSDINTLDNIRIVLLQDRLTRGSSLGTVSDLAVEFTTGLGAIIRDAIVRDRDARTTESAKERQLMLLKPVRPATLRARQLRECPVCYESYGEKDSQDCRDIIRPRHVSHNSIFCALLTQFHRELSCNHVIGLKCISRHMESNNGCLNGQRCPFCRRKSLPSTAQMAIQLTPYAESPTALIQQISTITQHYPDAFGLHDWTGPRLFPDFLPMNVPQPAPAAPDLAEMLQELNINPQDVVRSPTYLAPPLLAGPSARIPRAQPPHNARSLPNRAPPRLAGPSNGSLRAQVHHQQEHDNLHSRGDLTVSQPWQPDSLDNVWGQGGMASGAGHFVEPWYPADSYGEAEGEDPSQAEDVDLVDDELLSREPEAAQLQRSDTQRALSDTGRRRREVRRLFGEDFDSHPRLHHQGDPQSRQD